jgi:FMN phosphatase YigB (HAD superfamily)
MADSIRDNGQNFVGKPIETVFFDWDHTLAYTRTQNNTLGERLAMMFALADLPYTQSEIEAALALYEKDVAAGKIEPVVEPQKRRDITRIYAHLFDYLGEEDKSWPILERLYGTYALLPTYLYEDSRPTLSHLQQQGYKLGIISNHSSQARPVIERLVGDLIPSCHILISEEIGVHKPAKTIFQRAAARLRTDPSRCIILVGDNLEVDAIGSVSTSDFCGGIWLDRHKKGAARPLPEGVVRITSLDELPPLLAQCRSAD